jgi:hypothetical protein
MKEARANDIVPASDAETADLVLFCDPGGGPHMSDITQHPVYLQHSRKCVVLNTDDDPLPIVPGLYASLRRSLATRAWCEGGVYFAPANSGNYEALDYSEARHLFVVQGSLGNHPVRGEISRIAHEGLVVDTSHFPKGAIADTREYMRTMAQGEFVLCPRGCGCGSIRLFEAMEMGRCPVILSDDWTAPVGPQWETFSLRIQEVDAAGLPAILKARRAEARIMGVRAREAYEQYFAPGNRLRWVVNRASDIAGRGGQVWLKARMRIIRECIKRSGIREGARTARWLVGSMK